MASYLIFLLSVAIVFCKVHLNTIQKGVEDENSYVTKKLFEGTIKNLTDLILTRDKIKDTQEENDTKTIISTDHVLFYVTMPSSDVQLNKNSIVKFTKIIYNVGNHFFMGDSIFISPVSGIYLFSISIQTHLQNNMNIELRVGNVVKGMLNSGPGASAYITTTRTIICMVNQNDHVWIQTSEQFSDNFFDHHFGSESIFVGVLLFRI